LGIDIKTNLIIYFNQIPTKKAILEDKIPTNNVSPIDLNKLCLTIFHLKNPNNNNALIIATKEIKKA